MGIRILPSEASITSIDAELVEAMRKFGATPEDMIFADASHPQDAYDTLQRLGARSDLLVGCIGNTMNDRRVLNRLHRWNTEEF